MSVSGDLRSWWQMQTGSEDTPFDGDSTAFLASLVFHMCLLLVLGFMPLMMRDRQVSLTVTVPTENILEDDLKMPQDFAFSPQPADAIGANSVGDVAAALSLAPEISDISDVPSVVDITPTVDGTIDINHEIQVATGFQFNDQMAIKGAAGEGVTGAAGAIDRLTEEILRSLEQRKTLVVWLFDQSGSLARQRQAIHDRFDRIYEELGVIEAAGNPAFAKYADKPLLTSVIGFGDKISVMTEKPTDDLAAIKQAVADLQQDESGVERVFSAINLAVDRYRNFRIRDPVNNQPERNVMLVAFTDERGDDYLGVDATIEKCRNLAVPVYVVGVPAPFGREESRVKWIDPDPQYDQSARWGLVNQGPESLRPERIKLRFVGADDEEQDIDSGFGPFALTRLCYETGGIYFAVHPNRNVHREVTDTEVDEFASHLTRFFDPQVMRRYRPDYVPLDEYDRRMMEVPSRAALVRAAELSWLTPMEAPKTRFVKRSEAELSGALSEAQKAAAKLEPSLLQMLSILKTGEQARDRETSPRWQAGFDLAMGRLLAVLVRTQGYNAMLAEAKRGINFQNPQNNTWILETSADLSVDSRLSDLADKAQAYLLRVVQEHPDTPWAVTAERELAIPLGWTWTETFTDLAPRRNRGNGNNNAGGNDVRREVERKPVKRPIPKL